MRISEGGGLLSPRSEAASVRGVPFWPELVGNKKNWNKAGEWCPGVGKGELVQIQMARAVAAEMREAHPHLY
jgi:uncharacterized protein